MATMIVTVCDAIFVDIYNQSIDVTREADVTKNKIIKQWRNILPHHSAK